MDFTRLSTGSAADRATEPRRIFAALPSKDPKYNFPRDVQSEIWEQWHSRRDEKDLLIKMNTGGGKTVVGLLILKSCLNEKRGPAVYLVPDKYLAAQVCDEAKALGIETTDDPRAGSFLRGRVILVVTLQRLVNGKSVFGISGDPQRIPIGSLLVDDAHVGVADLKRQFTLKIPSGHDACAKLLSMFESDLQRQNLAGYQDVLAGDRSAVLRVPFWTWYNQQQAVVNLLHQYREDSEFMFQWPLISDCLPVCDVAVSATAVEIAPPCPPVDQIPSLVEAGRRIYLTATLADDSILVTHFDADPETVAQPITPTTAADQGDRMILAPLEIDSKTTEITVKQFLAEKAQRHNVVIIVPSFRRADYWKEYGARVYDKDSIYEGVEALRSGHVGLVVLVNKYDGIDLPGDACRILAIDGLPEVYDGLERLEALALSESEAMAIRQIQRIEQGMGRGVRSNEDYCVVMLLGSRLTQRLYNPTARAKFSPATRAQLDLADRVADMLVDKSFADVSESVEQCLSRNRGWVEASRDALDGVTHDPPKPVPALAIAQRRAFNLAVVGQYAQAAEAMQDAVDVVSDLRLKGWVQQQLAAYQHPIDPVRAQQILTSALSNNRNVTKPLNGAGYQRLSRHLEQAIAAANYLGSRYSSGDSLVIGLEAILSDLVPDPERTPSFEQAWADLGEHLGFVTQRPERDTGTGPDVLWLLGDLKFHVIECKSGTTTASSIARKDAEQLSHSMDWFVESYDQTCIATPILIHKVSKLHRDASAREGTRIITFGKLDDLQSAVRGYGQALAVDRDYADQQKVKERLATFKLTASQFVNAWATVARKSQ